MSEPNASPNIDRHQAILLASRVFAAFLLFWVVEDITELPRELYFVTRYLRLSMQAGMSIVEALRSSYSLGEYMLILLTNVLHIALWLLAAGWFYRCDPRIRRFFAAGPEESWQRAIKTPPDVPEGDVL